jgi:hypothetical protein
MHSVMPRLILSYHKHNHIDTGHLTPSSPSGPKMPSEAPLTRLSCYPSTRWNPLAHPILPRVLPLFVSPQSGGISNVTWSVRETCCGSAWEPSRGVRSCGSVRQVPTPQERSGNPEQAVNCLGVSNGATGRKRPPLRVLSDEHRRPASGETSGE